MQIDNLTELRTHYGDLRAKVLNSIAWKPSEMQGVDISMDASVKERLGQATFDQYRAAAIQAKYDEQRQALKEEYERLALEEQEAISQLVQHSEEVLSPDQLDASALVQAVNLQEDALIRA